ncbi:MAG: winged helix-turn-helix domain-containing protein [Bryobacteraceae bacterium]|nr:winged helix-turn-helix domain-containing protein [Bryobacteraceae bacterium]
MKTNEDHGPVVFGPFQYDPSKRQLFRASEPVDLQPKMLETLHVLAVNAGSVVEKQEIVRAVWPDTVVEEVGLARNISQLRKLLGGEESGETYIQTVPRRGYRLVPALPAVAPTDISDPAPAPARHRCGVWAVAGSVAFILFIYWQFYLPSRWLPGGEGRADLVVVPFEGEPKGFSEALAAELASNSRLRVISPSTVRRYRALRFPDHWTARILGAALVVEGEWPSASVPGSGAARLTDVHSGRMIWSGRLRQPEPEAALEEVRSAIGARIGQR